jgi:hypothetical protein
MDKCCCHKLIDAQQEKVIQAIDDWIKNGKPVPTTIRRAVREKQELGKCASSTTRELAIHFLTTRSRNVFCLYHFHVDKKGGKRDGQQGEKYKVMGIPLARNANEVKGDRKERPEGYLHCGCDEDIALTDFYLWKHWTAESGGYKEGMKDKFLDPRTRCFVVATGLNRIACLFIDDLYNRGRSDQETVKSALRHQIKRLLKSLKALEAEEEDEEEDGDEEPGAEDEKGMFSVQLVCSDEK